MSDIAQALFAFAPYLQEKAKRSSSYIMIQCPFHGDGRENNPSCSVSLEKPVFHCHSCGTSGHISQLFKNYGIGPEAIKGILRSTGLDKPYDKLKGKVAARLTKTVDTFRGMYVLDEELLDDYRLAPKALLRAGFAKETLRHFEVGYDATNMRITFPIRNVYGELVGISGRAILDYQEPRYKIYDHEMKMREGFQIPETYTMETVKDSVLWHSHVVRPFFYSSSEQDDIFVVTEGFKACMWSWQSGYKSSVALIGAYLSDIHAELIASSVQYVLLFLDHNPAGWKGTLRAGRVLSKYGLDVRVAAYPDDRQQPDDLTPQELTKAVAEAPTYLQWRQHDYVQQLANEKPQQGAHGLSAG